MMNAYEMAVNNLKNYIRKNNVEVSKEPLNVFDAAFVIAVAFCKTTEEVIMDLIK